eukprot:1146865-Pelagomonas_calceolata.AAC.6
MAISLASMDINEQFRTVEKNLLISGMFLQDCNGFWPSLLTFKLLFPEKIILNTVYIKFKTIFVRALHESSDILSMLGRETWRLHVPRHTTSVSEV